MFFAERKNAPMHNSVVHRDETSPRFHPTCMRRMPLFLCGTLKNAFPILSLPGSHYPGIA